MHTCVFLSAQAKKLLFTRWWLVLPADPWPSFPVATGQRGGMYLSLPHITKPWLPFSFLQDFVSCIENYRRKGQELYASLYRDYVQVRIKACPFTTEYTQSYLESRERKGKRKRRENPAFVLSFRMQKSTIDGQWWVQLSWLAQWHSTYRSDA